MELREFSSNTSPLVAQQASLPIPGSRAELRLNHFQAVAMLEADIELDPDTPWRERALCAQTDPEAFFPENGGSSRAAKRICAACDVRLECLEEALENDERYGVFGGLSQEERRRLKRRRNVR